MPKQTINQTGFVEDSKAISQQNKTTPPPMVASTTSSGQAIADRPKASMEMGPQQTAPPKVTEALKPSNLQEETKKKAAADIATTTSQAAAVEEKKPQKKIDSSFMEKATEMKGIEMNSIMKSIKRFGGDDYEDRQLMLNIGVSVLVIVALGAYITYSCYRSSYSFGE